MKKTELKYCDVVEIRDGSICILLKGNFEDKDTVFMDINTGSFVSFNHNDDLTSEDSYFDIMKVKHFKYSGDAFRALGMIRGCSKKKITWDWEREKKYNSKVVCIESHNKFFTKGKIYKVEEGDIYDDEGDLHYMKIENLNDLNENSSQKFIELVEDWYGWIKRKIIPVRKTVIWTGNERSLG